MPGNSQRGIWRASGKSCERDNENTGHKWHQHCYFETSCGPASRVTPASLPGVGSPGSGQPRWWEPAQPALLLALSHCPAFIETQLSQRPPLWDSCDSLKQKSAEDITLFFFYLKQIFTLLKYPPVIWPYRTVSTAYFIKVILLVMTFKNDPWNLKHPSFSIKASFPLALPCDPLNLRLEVRPGDFS